MATIFLWLLFLFGMAFEVQAHRGARSFFPENTLQAFCKAADIGVRVLELDLVVSTDHEIVGSHDPWLSAPLCSDPQGHPFALDDRWHIIYNMCYEEIACFDCGRAGSSFFIGQSGFDRFSPYPRHQDDFLDGK